jgi:hypothetical protein
MTKLLTISALILCLATFAPQASAAPPGHTPLAIPVTGTDTSGGALNGVFTLTGFTFNNGQLTANGIVTGTVTHGADVTSFLQTVSAPVTNSGPVAGAATAAATSCGILHLVIGPINLNLLGLTVTTNQIVLDISAVPGAGNLLGNLLCSVANLLNSPSQTLANLLNQIVAILNGL